MKTHRPFATVAAACVSLLVLAGCAEDGATGTDEAPNNSIKIFMSYPDDGGALAHVGMIPAAEAAVAAVNEAGGVKGRPLELITCNNRQDQGQAMNCVIDASNNDEIVALVGQADVFTAQTLPVLEEAGIPSVGLNPQGVEYDGISPMSFPLTGGTVAATAMQPFIASELGFDKIASQPCEYPSCQSLAGLLEESAPKFDVNVVGSFEIPIAGVPDFAPFAQSTRDTGAEYVVQFTAPTTALGAIKSGDDVGYHPVYAGDSQMLAEKENKEVQGLFEGYLLPGPWPSPRSQDYPIMEQYVTEMAGSEGMSPQDWLEKQVFDFDWTFMVNSWLAVHAFADAAELIDGDVVDRSTLLEMLNDPDSNISLFDYIEWTPGKPGPAGYERFPSMYSVLNKIEDGQLVTDTDVPMFNAAEML